MKTLIIGAGEIGKSLGKVFCKQHEVHILDIDGKINKTFFAQGWADDPKMPYDVLNICYPPSKDFVKITKAYIARFKPRVTIIHSTVAPGTTQKCGHNVVHSPVHGKHPDISGGLLNWVKFLGGESAFAVNMARDFLMSVGIKVKVVADSKTSEISKILCTSYYGWNIVFMKEVVKICEQYGVPFHEVYLDWNYLYNQGCKEANETHGHFVRPLLRPIPGKIGGHCVVENCALLKSEITDFIIKKNDEYRK